MKLQTIVCVFFCFIAAYAAPYNGDEFEFSQPDGSSVAVLLFGDEFHIDAETLDGYTLIRDKDGWICYAKLSADGNEYVSSGIRYTGKSTQLASVKKKIRISSNSLREKRQKKREALGNGENEYRLSPKKLAKNSSDFLPAPVVNDTTYGLVLIINYPEDNKKSSLTAAQVEDALNSPANSNSVWSYYYDVSNGKLMYKNIFSTIVTVDKSFSYYDDTSEYKRVPELITNALLKFKAKLAEEPELSEAFDKITTYTRNNRPTALALNVLHAHSPRNWSKGTWSHKGWYTGGPPGDGSPNVYPSVNGVYFYDYQLSALSGRNFNTMPINTILHENGHMLMGWPDLYNYDNTIKDYVGLYDIMNTGTAMPNPYLRDKAGWIDVIDITNANATLSHIANSHTAYVYKRNNNEMYYIEARAKTGRSSSIPGSGLIIWHIHTRGDNTTLNSKYPYPQVAVVQANATSSDWVNWGSASSRATFAGPARASFSENSMPAAQYYDNTMSPINISEVSAAGSTMTFKIGTGDPLPSNSDPDLTLVLLSQTATINFRVQSINNTIVLTNLPKNAKVEIYNLQGKRIFSSGESLNRENRGSDNLRIQVQTKGIYIAKIKFNK
ncbi:MAG: T9SS type A sorting domain-containing protein [Fibromonadales bacterium]|nr:T9SS type A sorting domain-containing protein [Fibromonadales bacterium]